MNGRIKDLTGKRFGRWSVLAFAGVDKNGKATWLCRCDCGTEKLVVGGNLRSGISTSCGCYEKELITKHGHYNTRLYQIWQDMKQRCCNPKNNYYKNYGGRGISVCNEWLDNFIPFMEWAYANGYQENLTIDRINVNGDYEPSNCRWTTVKEQNRNTTVNKLITYNGETRCVAEWAEKLGLSKSALLNRLRSPNYTLEQAMSEPAGFRRYKNNIGGTINA